MGQTGQANGTSFTGTLLKREQASGHKLVQLLFHKEGQNILCVSTDLKNTAWEVGRNYNVKGVLVERGGRAFIENPHISPIKKRLLSVRQWTAASVALAVFATGGTALAMHIEHYSVPGAEPLPVSKHVSTTTSSKPDTTSLTAAAYTPTTTTTATTTTKPAATSQQPATTQTADPNACTEQALPYTPIHEYSDTVPAGTDIQAGVNGSENVCPDGSITDVTLPVAERVSDGPAPAAPVTPSTDPTTDPAAQ